MQRIVVSGALPGVLLFVPSLLAGLLPACVLASSAARAADWYTGATTSSEDWIVAADAAATVTSQGSRFVNVTVTGAAAGSLSQSGPRVRVEGMAGQYGVRTLDGRARRGDEAGGAGLVGYEWVGRDLALAGYLGLSGRRDVLPRGAVAGGADGDRIGVKGVIEAYARPSETTFVQGYGAYSSAYNAYFARLRGGVAVLGLGYVGPEVAVLGDDFFRQWRVGAHLTALQFGALQFGVSLGYAQDRALKGGLYTSLDVRGVF